MTRYLILTLGGLGAACLLAGGLGKKARGGGGPPALRPGGLEKRPRGGEPAAAPQELLPISQRFAPADVSEAPGFQRHVSPLFGRLGCNGRACHTNFQST